MLLSGLVGLCILGVQSKVDFPKSPSQFVNWKIQSKIKWGLHRLDFPREIIFVEFMSASRLFLSKWLSSTILTTAPWRLIKDSILSGIEFTSYVAWPSPCSKFKSLILVGSLWILASACNSQKHFLNIVPSPEGCFFSRHAWRNFVLISCEQNERALN